MAAQAGVQVLQGEGALDRLGPDFDDLLEVVAAPITFRRRWLEAWVRAEQFEPLIVTVREDDGVAGVAPLAMTRRRGVGRIVMIGHGSSDRTCLPVRDQAAAEQLADAIVAAAASWRRPWRLHLEQLPTDDPVAHVLVERLPRAQLDDGDECPVLSFDRGRDPGAYVRRGLRRNLNGARNRLERDGRDWSVHRSGDPTEIQAALGDILDLRRARDGELGRSSGVDDAAGEQLWRELVSEHARAGEVEIFLLRVDGRLGGYSIVFLDRCTYRLWDSRIDSEFSFYSPGHLLAEAMLHAALSHDQITALDMGRGTQADKRLLAPENEERLDVVATSSAWVRFVLEAPGRARWRLSQFKDRHPLLRRTWVRWKRWRMGRGGRAAQPD